MSTEEISPGVFFTPIEETTEGRIKTVVQAYMRDPSPQNLAASEELLFTITAEQAKAFREKIERIKKNA